MKNGKPKVAIVHDWLVAYAGADRVVDCMHHVFPDAPIYTLVYDENIFIFDGNISWRCL